MCAGRAARRRCSARRPAHRRRTPPQRPPAPCRCPDARCPDAVALAGPSPFSFGPGRVSRRHVDCMISTTRLSASGSGWADPIRGRVGPPVPLPQTDHQTIGETGFDLRRDIEAFAEDRRLNPAKPGPKPGQKSVRRTGAPDGVATLSHRDARVLLAPTGSALDDAQPHASDAPIYVTNPLGPFDNNSRSALRSGTEDDGWIDTVGAHRMGEWPVVAAQREAPRLGAPSAIEHI